MPTTLNLARLSDLQLLASARELARQERILNLQIIDHLTEIAARGLHLRHGYSTLFAYAVKELGFSEGAAHYRIQAKKLCADYPEVKQQLEEGTLTLTGAGQLQSAFERHARRQRQRAREERRRESSGVSGPGGVGGPDGAGETAVSAEGDEAGAAGAAGEAGVTGQAGEAGTTGQAGAPGTAGTAGTSGTPLSESVKLELIEQAQGKTTRQISELIAAVDPELVRSRDRLRPLGGDRWELKAVIDGACQRGLEELRHLLSHVNPAMEYGELLQRLVADGLAKYDPARRPARVRQPKSGSAAQPAEHDPGRTWAQKSDDPQPSPGPSKSVHQPKPAAAAPAVPTNSESPRHGAPPERNSEPRPSPGQGVAATPAADSETAATHRDRAGFTPPAGAADRGPHDAAPPITTANRGAHHAAPPPEIDRGRTWAPKSDNPQPAGSHRATRRRARATITRTIPAAVRRHIWLRDRGRCTYRDPESGRCCGSRHLVQIDHVQPYAMGGSTSAENLRLLCGAHNRDRAAEKRRKRPAH